MVTPGYYPIKGGTETLVYSLSRELQKLGVKVDVMTFNMDKKWHPKWRGKIEETDGITVIKIPALNWLPMVNSPRIKLGINVIPGRFQHVMKKYDIVHFHEAEFSFPLFSYLVKKPKILQLHGIKFGYFERYALSRLILKNVAYYYFCPTQIMINELLMLGIPRSKIAYFPNSVDTRLFKPCQEKEDNALLYIGRIDPTKGLHILLKSLKFIKNPVKLEIIGRPDWDINYYKRVLQLIEIENKKGIHEIKYIGDFDPNHPHLIERYQKASVLVVPSFYEAFGMVIIEALACETPVIATNTGGTPEIIKNGENGIIVPVNDPIKLAEAIDYLLSNKHIRINLGKTGREKVVERFSITAAAKKLYTMYEKILDNQWY